jgi:hypothetical protein
LPETICPVTSCGEPKPGQAQGDGGIEEQGRENLVVVPIVLVIRVGTGPEARVAGVERIDGGQPLGRRHGQRAQQNGVEEGEDGGIGPDAEGERKHGGKDQAAGFR